MADFILKGAEYTFTLGLLKMRRIFFIESLTFLSKRILLSCRRPGGSRWAQHVFELHLSYTDHVRRLHCRCSWWRQNNNNATRNITTIPTVGCCKVVQHRNIKRSWTPLYANKIVSLLLLLLLLLLIYRCRCKKSVITFLCTNTYVD